MAPFEILIPCPGESLCEPVLSETKEVLPREPLLSGDLMRNWYVYIVDKRGKFYVGITTDLPNRMRQHGVVKPLYQEGPLAKSEALKRERTLKGLSRKKKLELIAKASSQQT